MRWPLLALLPAVALAGGFGGKFGRPRGASAAGRAVAPVAPTVVGYGDSIMAGEGSGGTLLTHVIQQLPPGWFKVEAGISGQTADQIAARAVAGLATACGDKPCSVCVFEGGVNDVKGGGAVSGAAAVDRMRVAIDYARATSVGGVPVCRRIVWVGLMPFRGWPFNQNDDATQQRAKDFNARMLSDCTSAPLAGDVRVRCVFPYATFEAPDRPTYLKAPCDAAPNGSGDGLHLPPSCADELAGLLVQPIQALP